jgi:hypothetical protein
MSPPNEHEAPGPYAAWWNSLTPEAQAAHKARQADQETARVAGVSVDELWRRRKDDALTRLNAAGNPGRTGRRVPGEYHLSLAQRLLGRPGTDRLVEVEAAWPVGTCTWERTGARGVDEYFDLPTGITPSGRLVPMQEGTRGDGLHILYEKLHEPVHVPSSHTRRTLSDQQIAEALEDVLRRVGA